MKEVKLTISSFGSHDGLAMAQAVPAVGLEGGVNTDYSFFKFDVESVPISPAAKSPSLNSSARVAIIPHMVRKLERRTSPGAHLGAQTETLVPCR